MFLQCKCGKHAYYSPTLAVYIADLTHTDTSLISAITSIEKIEKGWSNVRDECIAILENQLERFEEYEPDVNGFLIMALVELGAKEAAPLIKRAFDEGYVDWIVMGDWNDVQVELGLKSAEEVAPEQTKDWKESLLPSSSAEGAFTPVYSQAAYKDKTAQKKTKSKMAKLSRKKNRKR